MSEFNIMINRDLLSNEPIISVYGYANDQSIAFQMTDSEAKRDPLHFLMQLINLDIRLTNLNSQVHKEFEKIKQYRKELEEKLGASDD